MNQPINPEAVRLHEEGAEAFESGDVERARELFSRALAIAPNFTEAQVSLGVVLFEMGEEERAMQLFEQATQSNPEHAGAGFIHGIAALAAGKPEEAIAMLEQTIQKMPGMPEPYMAMAEVYRYMGALEKSREQMLKAREIAPDNLEVLVELAHIQMELGEPAEAERLLRRAIEMAPENATLFLLLGSLLAMQAQPDEAFELFKRADQLDPNNMMIKTNLAAELDAQGRQAAAQEMATRAAGSRADVPEAYYALASLYAEWGMPEQAIPLLQQAVAQDDEYYDAYQLLYDMAVDAGRDDIANMALTRLEAMDAEEEEEAVRITDEAAFQSIRDMVLGGSLPEPPTRGRKGTPPQPLQLPGSPKDTVFQLKIQLKHIRPPIWRRVLVTGDTTLAKLNHIIQAAIGWTNSHLHNFFINGIEYGVPDKEAGSWGPPAQNEKRYTLAQVVTHEGMKFRYIYDFGDDWEHEITVEKVLPREKGQQYPACVKGKRHGPPEDVGGPWGYADFLDALADPKHPSHKEMKKWIGGRFDPEDFDAAECDAEVKRVK